MPKLLLCILTILAGTIFILSGLGKIGNIVGFQRLIIEYGLSYLNWVAPFVVLIEILLGCLLIFGYRLRTVSLISIILLIIFTCAYSYAYIFNGITDCGCFGRFIALKPTPLLVYIRNLFLVSLLIISYIYGNNHGELAYWKRTTLITTIVTASFVAGMTYKPFAFIKHKHPFENLPIYKTPLTQYSSEASGESELMLFLSYSCPHCINSLENYKAWKADGAVKNATAYVIIDSADKSLDSLRTHFQNRFASIQAQEVNAESIDFIDAYPTAFVVMNDTIKHIIRGELPSHYTIW